MTLEVDLGSEPLGARSEIAAAKVTWLSPPERPVEGGTVMVRPVRIYISGPMTGYPEYNLPAFSSAHSMLTLTGYTAVNPGAAGVIEGYKWQDYMRDAIKELVTCNAMAMLPGWTTSKGADLEHTIGEALGMDIRELGDWL